MSIVFGGIVVVMCIGDFEGVVGVMIDYLNFGLVCLIVWYNGQVEGGFWYVIVDDFLLDVVFDLFIGVGSC